MENTIFGGVLQVRVLLAIEESRQEGKLRYLSERNCPRQTVWPSDDRSRVKEKFYFAEVFTNFIEESISRHFI